jgi:hypothetical protein
MTPDDIRKLASVIDASYDSKVPEVLRACADVVEAAEDAPLYGHLLDALDRLNRLEALK